MCRSVSAIYFLAMAICMCVGCDTTDQEKSEKSSVQAASADAKLDEKQHQYRAVCVEKEAHGGNEYVLSRWLDNRDKANELAQYHGDFKYKGHRWRIDERERPDRVKP